MKLQTKTPDGVEVIRLEPGDDSRVEEAADLFDHKPQPDAVQRFLQESNHHLLIAYRDGASAGFVTGVETTHPDKGTEMFLYELGVHEAHRQHGVGVALVSSLLDMARQHGCYGMWVLTDDSNPAALRTYAKAGGRREKVDQVMFEWKLDMSAAASPWR
jgi:ribosomal protein S18 acetylase RimI-like enzyme